MSWQPISTAPKHREVLAWREDAGTMLCIYTYLADSGFLTEKEQDELDEDTLFKEDWFWFGPRGMSRMEGNEVPTYWMLLPEPAPQSDGLLPGARRKYKEQRRSARARHIRWEFTFETWCAVWLESGKWEQRGRGIQEDGTVGYVMGRRGDVGPYSPSNVYIITGEENGKEARRVAPTKSDGRLVGLGKGYSFRPDKSKRNPYQVNCLGKYIGLFPTEAAAREAYLAAVTEFFETQTERA